MNSLIIPESPPVSILSQISDSDKILFEDRLVCGGVKLSVFDRIFGNLRIRSLADSEELIIQDKSFAPHLTVGRPSGTALFKKADIDAADRNMRWQTPGRTLHHHLQWLNYTLGTTCGVGLAYAENGTEPHIRLSTLPPGQMRGAIGWMYGPPLARNRTMQLSTAITADYYFLRLLQHEFGHFLGHYGSGSHSNNRNDIMYPSLQHKKAASPYWGYSTADIAWAVRTFGEPWIIE